MTLVNDDEIKEGVTQFYSRYHIPGVEPTAANTRIDMRQTRVASKGELRPKSGVVDKIRLWFGLGDYKHNEFGINEGLDGVQQTFTSQDLETRLETLLKPA